MTTALLGLGGNRGNVRESFAGALERLQRDPRFRLVSVSRIYQTGPVGKHAGDPFLNAAVAVEAECPVHALLKELQTIESAHGRTRSLRWGPRTLDLDVIGFGDQIVQTPELTVPHPACWYRRFVLDPLAEVAPGWRHPLLKETATELRRRLLGRPLRIAVLNGSDRGLPEVESIRETLRRSFAPEEVQVLPEEAVPRGWELAFSMDPRRPENRLVMLHDAADPDDLALQTVKAALDVPLPVRAGPDWFRTGNEG